MIAFLGSFSVSGRKIALLCFGSSTISAFRSPKTYVELFLGILAFPLPLSNLISSFTGSPVSGPSGLDLKLYLRDSPPMEARCFLVGGASAAESGEED